MEIHDCGYHCKSPMSNIAITTLCLKHCNYTIEGSMRMSNGAIWYREMSQKTHFKNIKIQKNEFS